jgi:2-iminobutanoate/2-iminopropanoate deaminase
LLGRLGHWGICSTFEKKNMPKQVIHTALAPEPIGPYSQAVRAGQMLYTSGQIAIDPVSNTYTPAPVEEEAELVMKNLEALLQAAGCSFKDVVKTSIFLQSMSDFAAVNGVYARYFTDQFPARETVEVACLPKSCKVEISVIALIP